MEAKHEIITFYKSLPFRCHYSNNAFPNYIIPHFHSDLEIIYLLTGTLTITQGSRTTVLEPNDMIVFNSNEIHAILADNNVTTAYVIQISFDFMLDLCENAGSFILKTPKKSDADESERTKLKEVQDIISQLFEVNSIQTPYANFKLLGLLGFLLHALYRNFTDVQSLPLRSSHKEFDRIRQIDAYLKEHYSRHIPLAEIADFTGLATTYFSKFFKNAFGISFSKYLNALRLGYARMDILTTPDAILDISEKNGFANYQLFAKSFKDMFGCTPLAYRKKYSGDDSSDFSSSITNQLMLTGIDQFSR